MNELKRANASRVDRSRASGNGNAASATAVSTAATAALETVTLETAAAARADAEIGRLDERGVGGGEDAADRAHGLAQVGW